jgi:hypothetical protein
VLGIGGGDRSYFNSNTRLILMRRYVSRGTLLSLAIVRVASGGQECAPPIRAAYEIFMGENWEKAAGVGPYNFVPRTRIKRRRS